MEKYTTDYLLASLRHIDRACFPDTISEIEQELLRRGVSIPAWVYAS